MTNRSSLFEHLKQGAVVITPNNRLADDVLQDYFNREHQQVLEKPHCMPYQGFLHYWFKQYCNENPELRHPLLLNSQQSRYLWADTLKKQLQGSINQGLVDQIQEAWSRCQRWKIDLSHPSFCLTPQTKQFQTWARLFQSTLENHHAITMDELATYLSHKPVPNIPSPLVWYCFDDFTPEQRHLQHYLSNDGVTSHYIDLDESHKKASLFEASDETNEQNQLIDWLKKMLKQGKQRIGVIVPNLESQEETLHRLLHQELPPQTFNISLGQPLNTYPLVSHALLWLALDTKTLTHPEAKLLLSSPYLGSSKAEMLARAERAEESKSLYEHSIDFNSFREDIRPYTPKLANLLSNLKRYPKQCNVTQWVQCFIDRLNQLGFPGEYPLNSASYQCYNRFVAVFDEFLQLHCLTSEMTKEEALSALNNLAKNTIFQAQKKPASIQILGLLEGSGCLFDNLWVMGVTDECLPQKTKLSAFIPVSLQQTQQMPHACPNRELALANTIISRLENSSEVCIFSYPRLSKDKPNLPSPLITQFDAFEATTHPERNEESPTTVLEAYTDTYVIPLDLSRPLTGTTALLANQAKCPFRAFAAHRLQIKQATKPSDGPNPMERGQVIHKVMELIWLHLKSQAQLFSISPDRLDTLIETSIQKALEPLKKLRPHSFSEVIHSVELERLKQLVLACLTWEKSRPPFEIEALEEKYTLSLNKMSFHLRIDRLDITEDNKKWVVDYKSALPSSMPWFEERPKEPQLLLYALLDENINTLLFTELKAGNVQCKGISENPTGVLGIRELKENENWESFREGWQGLLHDLISEFTQGICQPNPISPSICQQCDFQSLCRYTSTQAAPPNTMP